MAKVAGAGALAEAENSHLLESLEAGFALPSSWYTDEDLFALERERVLLRGWHFAAHTGQLGRAGDHVTLELAGVPIVVVRNAADGSGASSTSAVIVLTSSSPRRERQGARLQLSRLDVRPRRGAPARGRR